jgi:hypothetical protein
LKALRRTVTARPRLWAIDRSSYAGPGGRLGEIADVRRAIARLAIHAARKSAMSAAFVAAVASGIALAGFAAPARADDRVVELIPEDKAGWSPSQLFSFMRGGYYSDRALHVETNPPGAKLDLFYVRASFQKRYEQAEAPVTVVLPKRAEAGKRDSVTIRAALDGYQIETVHVPVRSDQSEIVIDLHPLSNTLAGVAHTYFAGREGLTFLTTVPAQVRVQNGTDGFSVVLGQTAGEGRDAAVLDGIKSPWVEEIESHQLGEVLMMQV